MMMAEDGTTTTGTEARTAPSAFPRQAESATESATPSDASELMVFRPQAP